ncbi:diacylglycerol kinase eta-like isoform X2 [Poecilia formosa]|uniref:diacylglycerol kinase eta-like isoform X2 n=1 Tax=Poecilia formosa TaxID=48698 RepID=UPI0007B88E8D|nr:PREDICTED: diacylglycerol kinase eta-like isoform X2 [Poecilia formosa]
MLGFSRLSGCCAALLLRRWLEDDVRLRRDYCSLDSRVCEEPQESVLEDQKSVKEGILLKQTSSFQRWKRRYFKLRGRTLYYAKDCKSLIFDEVDLSDASVAETSTKNINNSFTVSKSRFANDSVLND